MKNAYDCLDGFLLLDKPIGITSNLLVQKSKRLLCAQKVGHTGTLDPLASGLMLLCFGKKTKQAGQLMTESKAYVAEIVLGEERDTGDRSGSVVKTSSYQPNWDEVCRSVYSFIGPIEQTPPMHSALKKGGIPLYRLARRGIVVARPKRSIVVHGLILHNYCYPLIHITVFCSKGTYIRTLAEDIGSSLGCWGHLGQLKRTMLGSHHIRNSITLDSLEKMSLAERRRCLFL